MKKPDEWYQYYYDAVGYPNPNDPNADSRPKKYLDLYFGAGGSPSRHHRSLLYTCGGALAVALLILMNYSDWLLLVEY